MTKKTASSIPARFSFLTVAGTLVLASVAGTLCAQENPPARREMTPEEQQKMIFTAQFGDRILANVNDDLVTLDDLRRETQRYEAVLRREAKTQQEFAEKSQRIAQETFQEIVDSILLVSDFSDSGNAFPDAYLDAIIAEKITRDFDGDRGKYLAYLRERGSNPAADRKRERDREVANFQMGQLARGVANDVSPQQVFQFYQTNQDAFRTPESAEFAQIVLYAGVSESDAMIETAVRSLAERLQKTPDTFAAEAKIYSRDDFRAAGGYAGWNPLADLSPLVVETLKSLKNGEVSKPLEMSMPDGRKMFVILKRIGFREAGITPLKEVRARIEEQLRGQKHLRARMEKMTELRDRYFIRSY